MQELSRVRVKLKHTTYSVRLYSILHLLRRVAAEKRVEEKGESVLGDFEIFEEECKRATVTMSLGVAPSKSQVK